MTNNKVFEKNSKSPKSQGQMAAVQNLSNEKSRDQESLFVVRQRRRYNADDTQVTTLI